VVVDEPPEPLEGVVVDGDVVEGVVVDGDVAALDTAVPTPKPNPSVPAATAREMVSFLKRFMAYDGSFWILVRCCSLPHPPPIEAGQPGRTLGVR
jgi:hypothetical protein